MASQTDNRKEFHFSVDDKPFNWPTAQITGNDIRQTANIDPNFQLYLEEPGPDNPDKLISNDQVVDLSTSGSKKFYTVPPATMGF